MKRLDEPLAYNKGQQMRTEGGKINLGQSRGGGAFCAARSLASILGVMGRHSGGTTG